MTKLEAINAMLAAVGETPVASLEDSGPADALVAISTLDEVSREVQQVGWNTNTDSEFSVTPDINGWFTVSPAVLSLKTSGRSRGAKVSVRVDPSDGTKKVWNRVTQTFVWPGALTFTIVRLLDFDDLTPPLQAYVKARAALVYQARVLGSEVADAQLQRNVADTWAQLIDAEAQEEDDNLLSTNPHLSYGRRRNASLTGGGGARTPSI